MLLKVIDLCLLLKIHGCDIWFCDNVGVYNFHPIVKWWLKCSLIWWKKLGRIVSSLPLHRILLVHVHSTFGCFMCTLIPLLLLWTSSTCKPCHVTIGIFEAHNIVSATMANQVKCLLDSFSLLDKDEGFNLNTSTDALIFVVSCSIF